MTKSKYEEAKGLVEAALVHAHARDDDLRIWTVDLIGPLGRTIDVEATTEGEARLAAIEVLVSE